MTTRRHDGPVHRGIEFGVALDDGVRRDRHTGSLKVGIGWGAEGPKAGFFPFYLGV